MFALNRRTQISLDEWSDGFWLLHVALREIKGESPSFTGAHSAKLSMQAPTGFNSCYPQCTDVHIWEKLAGSGEGWRLCREFKLPCQRFATLHKDCF